MKKIVSIITISFLLLFLIGCKTNKPSGEVYDKEFRPAYSTTVLLPLTIYNGKTVTTIIIPYIYYYPNRYVIHIKWFDVKKDKWRYYEYFVNETLYEKVNVGDMFEYQKGTYDREPYTREKAK